MKAFIVLMMALGFCFCVVSYSYQMPQDAPNMPGLGEEALKDMEEAKDLTGEGGPEVGEDAPDFTLTGLDGKEVTLSSLRGKTPVILIFGSCT